MSMITSEDMMINLLNRKRSADLSVDYHVSDNDLRYDLIFPAVKIGTIDKETLDGISHDLDCLKYAVNDVFGVAELYRKTSLGIKNVIFNKPATIVFWMDNTKTVVKAENEEFDPEKGLAMAIVKKVFGNKGSYFNKIKVWTEKYNEAE